MKKLVLSYTSIDLLLRTTGQKMLETFLSQGNFRPLALRRLRLSTLQQDPSNVTG
jgi:hypothetical protein